MPPDCVIEQGAGDRLAAVATRLTDIADTVARDAEAATGDMRNVTDHANQIATLAGELANIADQVESSVAAQRLALDAARESIARHEPAIRGLAQSIDSVSSITALIAAIATESRFLSLNARIEAARAGDAGAGFAVVAREMSLLSDRTRQATGEIERRARSITDDTHSAQSILASTADLVAQHHAMLTVSLDMAGRQHDAAAAMSRITDDTVARIDDAAASIGRVASAAVATRLLAREVVRIAGR